MKKPHKRKGATYLLVIIVFIFVSLFSTLILSNVSQSVYQFNAYSLQMQCFYLNRQAADATVVALLTEDDVGNTLLKTSRTSFPKVDTMTHTASDGTLLGSSTITLTKENYDYYGESKEWAVARIETSIPDPRGSRRGEDFNYSGSVMVLVENPLIQLYNINPDSL